MEQPTKIVSVAALSQVRVLGRTTGTDVVNLFWTGSGIEFIYTGSEIQVEVNADYDAYEPWLAVELNGVQISRVPLNKGKNEVCLFRGMTVGKPKHVRILKEVQAMHQDPGHLLQIVGLQYADGEFQQLPEPKYRLEFVGDSITSGEGTVGAIYEEDWISAFFSAMNTYPRMVADALSAEYRVVSQSGWGIVTGWDGNVENKIPSFYTQVCGLLTGERNASLGALEDYDFEAWQPDAVIIGMVYDYFPYMILPIYSILVKLDGRLVEAARDLGCNGFSVLRRVVLPLSMPGIISGITMVLIPSISTFYISQKLGSGKFFLIGDAIEGQYVANNLHFAAAIAFVLMLILLAGMAIMKYCTSRFVYGGD